MVILLPNEIIELIVSVWDSYLHCPFIYLVLFIHHFDLYSSIDNYTYTLQL